MKLLAHNDGSELRGSERQLLILSKALQQRGHEILVSCRADAPLSDALRSAGIAVTHIRPRGDLDALALARFTRLVRDYQPDTVFLTSWKRLVGASYASKRPARAPRVVTRQGVVRPFNAGPSSLLRRIAFSRFIDALIVNSADMAAIILATAPWFERERLHIITNAIELSPPGQDQRHAFAVPAGAPVISFVGGIENRKGIDILLHALAQLPNAHLLIAGEGPARPALERMVASLNIGSRVHWLGHRKDVNNVLASSDVFALPSRQDSQASALLEAMAAGRAVITTQGSGAAELLGPRDGRPAAGWIVRGESVAELTRGVREALDAQEAAARGAEAAWRAAHWLTVDRMVDAYERVLFP